MPFQSQKQRAWMYANKPGMAKKWEKETPKGNLPVWAKKLGSRTSKKMIATTGARG